MTVKLPKDAKGREIPLDTSEISISDGTMAHAVRFECIYRTCDARGARFAYIKRTSGEHMTLYTCDVYLTEPDSWEKPEEDLDRCVAKGTACMYFGNDGTCQSRPIRDMTTGCASKVIEDIVSRIRKLRGGDE